MGVGVGGRVRRGRASVQDEVDDDDDDVGMDGIDGLMRGQEGRGDGWDGNQDVVEFLGVPVVKIALLGLCESQSESNRILVPCVFTPNLKP